MRIVLYARISTSDKNQDPEVQLRDLRLCCQQRGWQIVGEYVDLGVSGAKESRPELDRLMADAQTKQFDAVMVWRFDRFARSTSHLLRALETFNKLGIDFVSHSEAIDTSTPTGKVMFTILGAMAEFERDILRERVKAGMRNAKAKGRQIGRKPSAINPDAVRALRAKGRTVRQIASCLGYSAGLVHKTLQIPA